GSVSTTSRTEAVREPEPTSRASSSRLERADAPCRASLSRGRSSAGRSHTRRAANLTPADGTRSTEASLMAPKNRCYLADRGPAKPPRLTDPWPGPNNAREMGKGGSVPGRTRLPAALAPVVVVAGMGAMILVAPFAFALGLRPALLISETALIAPGLLALAAFRVPLS